MTELEVRRAPPSEALVIGNLMELYRHDLSEFWDNDVDAQGRYGYDLDPYWRHDSHAAFSFLVQGRYAGFALVNNDVCLPDNNRWMAQFFVMRKYRRRGVASTAAKIIFDSLPGLWEVGQLPANISAQRFWRKLIADYTQGAFTDTLMSSDAWDGPLQCFDNRVR